MAAMVDSPRAMGPKAKGKETRAIRKASLMAKARAQRCKRKVKERK